jgi:16S rRNA (uracil1498-N3)-methyltransferase
MAQSRRLDDAHFTEMRHPPRFAISADLGWCLSSGTVRVTGAELHHLRDVMRLSPGTEVMLCAADGLEYAGRIASFEPKAAIIKIAAARHQQESGSPRLILAAGVLKAARMDLLIEKATELNAAELWPLICSRCVVREPSSGRRERWHRISLAAAKQSLRSRPMEIREPAEVAAMVAHVPKEALAAACIPGAEPLGAVIRRLAERPKTLPVVVLAVGPEGDFTDEEIAAMNDAGFVAAGLGTRRLRSETAALAALSIATGVLAELEELECTKRANEPRRG